MGYYMAGDYYMAGGIFGSIGKFIGGAAKIAGGIIGGPVGGILRAGGGLLAPSPRPVQLPSRMPILRAAPPILGIPGLPPTTTGLPPGTTINKAGQLVKKRRRMNAGNAKALRRAIRREEAFVGLAKRALKGSKYTITTRGASRPRRDLPPGHRHVR